MNHFCQIEEKNLILQASEEKGKPSRSKYSSK